MIIGEAPGRVEDEVGKPFRGPAGKLLWAELKKLGIDRNKCMEANAVCCFPHRAPVGNEIYACRSNLYDQVRHCFPKWILAVGSTASWTLGKHKPMHEIRGEWYPVLWLESLPAYGREILVFPTYHPAAVLRNRALTRAWREDLKTFAEAVL
jgi:DNA polymerase